MMIQYLRIFNKVSLWCHELLGAHSALVLQYFFLSLSIYKEKEKFSLQFVQFSTSLKES